MTSASGLKSEIKEVGAMTGEDLERLMKADIKMREKILEFMEKRLNQTNVKEYIANNPDDSPPGLQVTAQYTVSIRKNKSYEEVE